MSALNVCVPVLDDEKDYIMQIGALQFLLST